MAFRPICHSSKFPPAVTPDAHLVPNRMQIIGNRDFHQTHGGKKHPMAGLWQRHAGGRLLIYIYIYISPCWPCCRGACRSRLRLQLLHRGLAMKDLEKVDLKRNFKQQIDREESKPILASDSHLDASVLETTKKPPCEPIKAPMNQARTHRYRTGIEHPHRVAKVQRAILLRGRICARQNKSCRPRQRCSSQGS